MVFSSLVFLFCFLPVFFGVYYLTPWRYKNLVALLGSYFFYAWGAPKLVFLLFLGSAVDYWLSKGVSPQSGSFRRRRVFLSLSLASNLGALAYFKYANFFVAEFNTLWTSFGGQPQPWVEVALPIGISFFTFQKLSYVIDVFRGTVSAASSFLSFALYVALFPQLIAGPIVRYHDVNEQLENRSHTAELVFSGVCRFSLGLAKKVLIANPLGEVADTVFGLQAGGLIPVYAWLGVLCYAMQIYFDFSGYSDMAIGLGRMMGLRFLENFDRPYISQSFTEFWRRWHISLSNWMREYLYIPLGGNRVGSFRRYLNLWIVFLLSGLWHGASWNFVAWGAFHGFFLSLDKLFWLRVSEHIPCVVKMLLTFFLVCMGWVLFRCETFSAALSYYAVLFDIGAWGELNSSVLWPDVMDNRAFFILALALLVSFFPERSKEEDSSEFKPSVFQVAYRFSGAIACFLLSVVSLANSHFNPFIYFRF